MADTSTKQIVLGAIAAIEGFDGSTAGFDRFCDACADSIVFEVAPTHESLQWLRWEGKEAVRGFLVPAFGHARDLKFVTNYVVCEGSMVVWQATEFATLTEALHGFPAGSQTRQEHVHCFEVRDGLIALWELFPGPHLPAVESGER